MGLSVFIVLFDTNIQTAIRANCNKMVDWCAYVGLFFICEEKRWGKIERITGTETPIISEREPTKIRKQI